MAKFSESLIRSLTTPGYQQGLFTAASQVGPALRRRRALNTARMLSSQFDPNTLEGIRGIADAYRSMGNLAEAAKYGDRYQALEASQTANRKASVELGQAQADALEDAGNLHILRQAVRTEAKRRGTPFDLAFAQGSGGMDQAALTSYLSGQYDPSGKYKGKSTELPSAGFAKADIYEDPNGNQYYVTTPTQKKGTDTGFGTVIAPVPGSPKNPTGKLSLVSRAGDTPGLTAKGILDFEAEQQESEAWGKQVGEAFTSSALARAALPRLERSRDILRALKASGQGTGALTAQMRAELSNFGFTEFDNFANLEVEFNALVAEGLKAAFGGQNITDSERSYYASTQPQLGRNTDVNSQIIDNVINGLKKKTQLSQWISQNPISDYDSFRGQREAFENFANGLYGFIPGGDDEDIGSIDLMEEWK